MPIDLHVLPMPPLALRQLVGLSNKSTYNNPTGALLFPDIPAELYNTVFDFGCGCGRLARQLIQQQHQPRHYLGIDVHREMLTWARQNLTPYAPQFEFVYHDNHNPHLNPQSTAVTRPFPVGNSYASLVIAASIFTHLLENQIEFYLRESARILRPEGLLVSTWFLFEKRFFPMLLPEQNSLFINERDPRNAVIIDRHWFTRTVQAAGLVPVKIKAPPIRGFQWTIYFSHIDGKYPAADWPVDNAPFGSVTAEKGILADPK